VTTGEVQATLAENTRLAKDLGLTGTPSSVIDDNVVIGAADLAALEEKIKSVAK
jgi:protein-disulfide isomerase